MIKRFIGYYKPHKRLFALDFSSAFFASLIDLIFPVLVRLMIDDIIPSKSMDALIWVAGGMMVLYVLRYILNYIVDYWGHTLGVRMEYDMRKDLFNHLQKLSFTYFDNTKVGHIMSRLVNDLNDISEFAHHGPEDIFIATVTLLGSFLILLTVHWPLALITFALMPFILWFSIGKNKKMQKSFRDMRVKIADVNAQAEDSFSGVRVVKSFTNEWFEEEKFDKGNRNFKHSKQNSYKVMAEFFSGIGFFSNLLQLIVLVVGGYFVFSGSMSVGALVQFLLYVSIFLQPIRKFTIVVEQYQKAMAGFSRFEETLNIEPDIKDKKDAKKMGRVKGNIIFKDVAFSYNNKEKVLENIQLEVNPGETIAFVGPSGAGKTTLCSLIPRFYEIDKGKITIDETDIKTVTQRSLRENIGIVQQDVFLFSGSIKENISYGKIGASEEDIIEAAKKANAHEFILNLENGYDTYIGERGVKLSGGQKQRISIARIFLKNPPILILDEATSNLDNESERIIQESFYRLSQSRTTLVIAHRLATIRNADRILVLTEEGIVEEGNHKELLAENGVYASLYKAQFDKESKE